MICIIMGYYGASYNELYPKIIPPTYLSTTILKFVCSVCLHLIMQPRIVDPIQRLQYVLHHPERFEQQFIPILICWMKIIAESGIELTLVVSTAYENDNVYLIMDFTALMVVYYIDTSYFESIKDDLKAAMINDLEMQFPITNSMTSKKLKDQDKLGKF